MLELVALGVAAVALFAVAGLLFKNQDARIFGGLAGLLFVFMYLRQPLLVLIVVALAISYMVYRAKAI